MSKYNTESSGWQVKTISRAKRQANKLAYVLYLQSIEAQYSVDQSRNQLASARVRDCSTYWTGYKCPKCGRLHRMVTYGCKHRLCPICATRKSRAVAAQAMQVMLFFEQTGVLSEYDFCLLTLTQKNVSAEALPREIDNMMHAWAKLRYIRKIQRELVGWARTVEITVGSDGSYHPHIHCILMLKKGSPLRESSVWRSLWASVLQLQYEPICDCRPITDVGAVYEVSKYVTKVGRILDNPDLGQCFDDVKTIGNAIYGRRLRSYGGEWAKVRRALRMVAVDDMDDGELDAAGAMLDGHDKCDCGAAVEAVCLYWSGMEYTEIKG